MPILGLPSFGVPVSLFLIDSDALACTKIKEGATKIPLTESKEWKGGYESRDIFAEKYKFIRFYLV
ncbi:hypothetical protein KTT_18560 [Tengunoibacter tsumagoiensis]|uniref:Uncharacterized protein n=1 Tax=Tengunoibacter tsumagoiensis TaxID=2014871 RepID=A0A401ZYT0_9CHLR|nr:hypothetical protein KTT_18560 [Tengunoibacter tsumagoiensis]